ncbi:MAG: fused MFS/spermidine synthase [Thermodesulfobacteriota bacterium]
MFNRPILLLFFLSGASSLILEVIWVKLFSLIFGNTVFAVSAVLSSFFSGLALGSYLLGHYCDRYRGKYLVLYGLIELTIAIYAFILPRLIPLVHFVYFPMIQGESMGFYQLSLVRFSIAFLLLILPTTLMGASLPVLTRYIVYERKTLGTSLGRLYAFNTLGAMTGTMVAGFILIVLLGVSGANLLAVSISTVVGLTALYLSKSEEERAPQPLTSGGEEATTDSRSALLLGAFALSGFCSLAYEVVWVRVLSNVFGPTTYSFSIILTTFLAGIASGSLVASRLADRWKSLLNIFGLMEVAIGLMAISMLPFFKQLPVWFSQLRTGTDLSWHSMISIEVLISFLLFFPPTFLLGGIFPLVGKLYVRTIGKLGGATGKMYAINTLGGIFGSAVAGFILLPWLGVKVSILSLASLNIGIGIILVIMDTGVARKTITAFGSGLALTGLLFYFSSFSMIEGLNLLFYKEDVAASVVVEEFKGTVSVWVSGRRQGMAPKYKTTKTDPIKKIGHFPLLLHPNPREVLMVGLGTGVSSGAVALHDVDRVDVIEIVPSLVETLKFFKEATNDILHDPRYRFIVDDGRNYMVASGKTYDVIISDIYHPDVAGIGNLYAREYYEAIQKRLNPDGLYAQWVTLYQMGPRELQSIVATMAEVFPHVTVWAPMFTYPGEVALILGSNEELMVDESRIGRRLQNEKIADDLFEKSNVPSLMSSYIMDEKTFKNFLDKAIVNTDDYPFIEYSAPKKRWSRKGPSLALKNLEYLQGFANPVTAHLKTGDRQQVGELAEKYFQVRKHLYRGEILKAKGKHRQRLEEYLQAARIDVNDPYLHSALQKTLLALSRDSARKGDWVEANRFVQSYDLLKAADPADDVRVFYARSLLFARLQDYESARRLLRKAIQLAPEAAYLRNKLKDMEKSERNAEQD